MINKPSRIVFAVCFAQCLLSVGLFTASIAAQSVEAAPPTSRAAKLSESVKRIKSGKFSAYDIEVISEEKAVSEIPDLEKQFTLTPDGIEKARIAQVLLVLGDKKEEYWRYLKELVESVLNSDAPAPVLVDAEGHPASSLSPGFVTWAQVHKLSPDDLAEKMTYLWPAYISILGDTGDVRAIPILEHALSSDYYPIVAAGAMGLGEIKATQSIPQIIAVCKAAPPKIAGAIAGSLVDFDDADAQSAVDKFVPKDKARALREQRATVRGAKDN